MKLSFPNPSRSFDASKNRVLFWGYDKTIEISFFVELDALKRLCPDMTSVEAGFLQAFDNARTRIYEVADKIYESGTKRSLSYVLAAKENFNECRNAGGAATRNQHPGVSVSGVVWSCCHYSDSNSDIV